MAKMMVRQQWTYVGAEREGKTYLSKLYATQYHAGGGGILAYNFGDADFPESEYHEIVPLTFAEHLSNFYSDKEDARSYRLNKTVDYFWFAGRIYHFRYFNRIFAGKKVRIPKVYNKSLERAFATAIFKYVSGFLLILDDTKMIFTHGLMGEFQQLFGRKNHTGKHSEDTGRLGIDIICIFHALDTVNPEIWDYTNSLILFKTAVVPSLKKIHDKQLSAVIVDVWNYLDAAPKYTAVKIDLKGEQRLIPKIIKT